MVWRVRIMIMLAVLFVLIVAAVLFWQSSFLDIDKFEAEGNTNTPLENIVAISGLSKGDQVYALNLGAVRKSVRRLPWVKDVNIKRSWGGTITFKITERQPIAVAYSRHGYVLLDQEGRVLSILGREKNCIEYAAELESLTCIANMTAPSTVGTTLSERNAPLVQVSQVLTMNELGMLARQIVLHSDVYAASVELSTGGWIYLGDPSEGLQEKISGAYRILMAEQLLQSNQRFCGNAILDVSVQNRAALTPGSIC